jgi:hypothetical protein
MGTQFLRLGLFVAVLWYGVFPTTVSAVAVNGNTSDCSKPTRYTEHNGFPLGLNTSVVVTDRNNKGAPLGTFPLGVIPAGGNSTIDIPALGSNNCDAQNIFDFLGAIIGGIGGVAVPGPSGAHGELSIETLFFDSVHSTFLIGSNSDFLATNFPAGFIARIPDVIADTNHDGNIALGDALYSWVDLTHYLPDTTSANPTFTMGQVVTITGSQIVGLPGLHFSLTPPVYNPSTGFSGTNVPDGTLGVIYAEHDMSSIPEPAYWPLAGAVLAGLSVARRRQNKLRANARL